jgi:hypothetical protein
VRFLTGAVAIRSFAVWAGACLIGVSFFVATAVHAKPMWREAKQWQCIQDEFEAACGGRFERQCRTQDPRKLENLIFDFGENMVVIEGTLGKSYIPLAARAVDRRGEITTLLYGEAGSTVMQYSNGTAVSMAMPPSGGAALLRFYSCLPYTPE